MKAFLPETVSGQHAWRFRAPGPRVRADIRLFGRGVFLDGTRGKAGASRERLVPLLGKRLPLIAPKQVHGTTILEALENNVLPAFSEADGILLDAPGMEASLRFADCAPVVVASTEGPNWVLLMHSGYKGTVLNIVGAGLEKVKERYGKGALSSACAWVGPCIGIRNYPRSREEWTERGLAAFHLENVEVHGEKVHFDIAGELKNQLVSGGIAEGSVFVSGIDTFESSGLCYSYRRGDPEDRMFLWAALS